MLLQCCRARQRTHGFQTELHLSRLLNAGLKQQLIVLDELGFSPCSPAAAQLLSQFCSTLYECVPPIITTNRVSLIGLWNFGDELKTYYPDRRGDEGCERGA